MTLATPSEEGLDLYCPKCHTASVVTQTAEKCQTCGAPITRCGLCKEKIYDISEAVDLRLASRDMGLGKYRVLHYKFICLDCDCYLTTALSLIEMLGHGHPEFDSVYEKIVDTAIEVEERKRLERQAK